MKNLYLSFCKFATLALMLGLTMRFLQFGSIKTFAQGAPGNAGSIWTTLGDCGESSQDVNHYEVGDVVYINGSNFDEAELDWEIKGQPGQASSDPNIVVADGVVAPNEDGGFCVSAYTVQPGDRGEYSVKAGNKGDNYRVDGENVVDLCADIEGNQTSVPEGRYQSGENCPLKIEVCTDPDASNYDSEVGSNEVANNEVCQCQVAQSCTQECGQPAANLPDGRCGFTECAATSACEDPTKPSMSSIISCGKIDMTFRNPTRWFFSFDYRVDEEEGTPDEVSLLNIANGPWAGQSFGLRYNMVDVLAGQVEERTVTFAEDSGTHKVEYRLWRGAENDMYLNWVSKTVESDCQEPSASPTPSPSPTEPPGYTCPVAQSCPTSCGQSAKDVPNGSCGLTHCGPTAPCDGGVGGVETSTTGQVLGATSIKSVATSSGQVLGATTYAATGIAEDIAFSLLGFTGAGLSGVGILLKRNEKNQK